MKSLSLSFAFVLSLFLFSSNLSNAAALPATGLSGYEADDEELGRGGTAIGSSVRRPSENPGRVKTGSWFCDSLRSGAYYVISGINNRTLGALGWTPLMGMETDGEEIEKEVFINDDNNCATNCLSCFNRFRVCRRRPFGPSSILSKRDVLAGLCGVVALGTAASIYYTVSYDPPSQHDSTAGGPRLLQTDVTEEADPFSFQTFFSATAGTVSAAIATVLMRRGWIMLSNPEGREAVGNFIVGLFCSCCRKEHRNVYTHLNSTQRLNLSRSEAYSEVLNFAAERVAAIDDGTYRPTVKGTDEREDTIIIYNTETKRISHLLVVRAAPKDFVQSWKVNRSNREDLSYLTGRDLESPTGIKALLNRVMDSSSPANRALMRHFDALVKPSMDLVFERQRPLGIPRIISGTEIPATATLLRFHELYNTTREDSRGSIRGFPAGVMQHDLIVLDRLPDGSPPLLQTLPFVAEEVDAGFLSRSRAAARPGGFERTRHAISASARTGVRAHPRRVRRASMMGGPELRASDEEGEGEPAIQRTASGNILTSPGKLGAHRFPRADTGPAAWPAGGEREESDDGMSIAAGTDDGVPEMHSRRLRVLRDRHRGVGRSPSPARRRSLSPAVADDGSDRESSRSVSRGRARPQHREDLGIRLDKRFIREAEIDALRASAAKADEMARLRRTFTGDGAAAAAEEDEEDKRATKPKPTPADLAMLAASAAAVQPAGSSMPLGSPPVHKEASDGEETAAASGTPPTIVDAAGIATHLSSSRESDGEGEPDASPAARAAEEPGESA